MKKLLLFGLGVICIATLAAAGSSGSRHPVEFTLVAADADPATLLSTFHTNHIHGVISIWPEYELKSNASDATDQDNYKALDALGALYPSGGSHHFYDTFSAEARKLVYQQIYDRLVGKYGWDGIWADNTEPQPYPDSVNMRAAPTALRMAPYVPPQPTTSNLPSRSPSTSWRGMSSTMRSIFAARSFTMRSWLSGS